MAIRELQREIRRNRGEVSRLEMTHAAAPPRAMVLEDIARPKDSPVFIRGEAENKGEIVPRRFLSVLSGPTRPEFKSGSGRVRLPRETGAQAPLGPRLRVSRGTGRGPRR